MTDIIRRRERDAHELEYLRALQDKAIKRLSYMRALRQAPLSEIRELEELLARIQGKIERLRRAG